MTIRGTVLGAVVFGSVAVAGLVAACGHDSGATAGDLDGGDEASVYPADDTTGINTTGVGAGTGADTGLPCDVQQILENYCIGCHLAGSAMPLLTYADLMKPSPTDPTKTMAVRALERIQNPDSPMPPKPAQGLSADEIATWKAWVDANTPKGTVCTDKPDGGAAAGDGGVFNTPLVCTSKKMWTGGDDGSSDMHPGGACITCHTIKGGPAFKVAGTVYPTAHEPNDCAGVNGAGTINVVVTDAHNKVTTIPVNSVGNFDSQTKIAAPFHVKVTNGTKVRAMSGSLTAGDCNSCHTSTGVNGAPGRIMAP